MFQQRSEEQLGEPKASELLLLILSIGFTHYNKSMVCKDQENVNKHQ